MTATLNIINSFEIESMGVTTSGKQGDTDDAIDEPKTLSVDGKIHRVQSTLATATVVTLFDDDNDVPIDWDYMHIWTDKACYVQLIGSGTNVILPIAAEIPFVLDGDSLLAAADTTIITGGSEPTLTDIDSVALGNYSGDTMNYIATFID